MTASQHLCKSLFQYNEHIHSLKLESTVYSALLFKEFNSSVSNLAIITV